MGRHRCQALDRQRGRIAHLIHCHPIKPASAQQYLLISQMTDA
jgi:hypothetical protein